MSGILGESSPAMRRFFVICYNSKHARYFAFRVYAADSTPDKQNNGRTALTSKGGFMNTTQARGEIAERGGYV